eukprot:6196334-Pleurochrysis_carterae.AAC.4
MTISPWAACLTSTYHFKLSLLRLGAGCLGAAGYSADSIFSFACPLSSAHGGHGALWVQHNPTGNNACLDDRQKKLGFTSTAPTGRKSTWADMLSSVQQDGAGSHRLTGEQSHGCVLLTCVLFMRESEQHATEWRGTYR